MKKASNHSGASLCRVNINYTRMKAQRSRLLESLNAKGNRGVNTIECRAWLDIMHPAGRIRELRNLGYDIRTLWTSRPQGRSRSALIARYVLLKPLRYAGVQSDLFEMPKGERVYLKPLRDPATIAIGSETRSIAASEGGGYEHKT